MIVNTLENLGVMAGVSYASVFTGGAAGEITCFVAGTMVATK